MQRLPWLLVVLALSGCPGEVPPQDDDVDGQVVDASIDVVGPTVDAGPVGNDANLPDGLASCTVGDGRRGTCITTTACSNIPDTESIPGFCPGGADIQCCVDEIGKQATCDPSERVQPNEGLAEAAGEGGCAAGMVRVPAATPYCIDKYEASLVNSDGTPWSPYFNPGSAQVRAVSIEGAVPQGYINGTQAAAACSRAGKRLCSKTEWERACKGDPATIYPYGDTREWNRCNDNRPKHPAVELFGSVTNLGSPCINQLDNAVDPSGVSPGCLSDDGPMDMMGNLHEWIDDAAGTFRGGFYVDTKINGEGCLYQTTAHDNGHWDYSTGFRCCKSL